MPHSSGGGSHGGGTHSGSSHHSGSSSSSGYSSSSSSYSESYDLRGFSRRPYDGASKYVYYDRRGNYHYLYRAGGTQTPSLGDFFIVAVLVGIIAVPIIWFLISIGLYAPKKIDINSYNANIIIEDTTGVIDKQLIIPSLEEFKEQTGVSPGIEVVYESQWDGYYTDLETFAYSEYLRLYDDEKHWLVVISYPDNYSDTEFVEWSWEGMNGDDNYPAFNSESENNFTTIFHKHLLRSIPDSISQNIANAYYEFSAIAMEPQISVGCLIIAGCVALIYIAILSLFFRSYLAGIKLKKCFTVSKNSKEYNCEYCGTKYVYNTVHSCPNCGAPIPVRQTKDKKGS